MSYGYQIFIHSHKSQCSDLKRKYNNSWVYYEYNIILKIKKKIKTIMITFYFDMMFKYILSYIV